MTEQQFRDSIRFKETDEGYFRKIRAHILLSHEVTVDKNVSRLHDACAHARKVASESLLRAVYEDRRKEFCDAIYDLHKSSPYESGYHEQVEKILALAKRQ